MQHNVTTFSRRRMLQRCGGGFGMIGLAGALQSAGATPVDVASTEAQIRTHFPAKAKRVIYLFMNGAPSHVDTFDPKPALQKYAGQKPEKTNGRKNGAGYMPSPFRFHPRGDSGVVMSELFPKLSVRADDVCVIRSMYTDEPNHEPGLLMMHSGNQQPIRPCLGSWASYGLGSENQNLPSFVVLCPGRPVVGPQLWSNAFLPGQHQGMAIDTNTLEVDKLISNLNHPTLTRPQQRRQLELIAQLNQLHLQQRQHERDLETQIRAMEMAFNMQREATEAFDVSREPQHIREMYGDTTFSNSCLLARRLSERGVRFVEVYYVTKNNKQPWDSHSDHNNRCRTLCEDADRATAALLTDLKQRGMLEDTLVVWGGEFGRTPYAQTNKKGNAGRDHHATGFSMMLAGGGIRGGTMYGATDEFGMHAVENRVHVHDLNATILHQLGIDHERLTYRYSGRDFRLTDVHGRVISDVLA
jgi:hypothetical protein